MKQICIITVMEYNNKVETKQPVKTERRRVYSVLADTGLTQQFRTLSIKQNRRQSDLIEEAIEDLLNKYGFQR